MKKVLELNNPPITSFPALAGLLGIVYNEKTVPWFVNNFIQIVTIKEFEFINEYYSNFYDDLPNNRVPQQALCPFIKTLILNRDSVDNDYIEHFIEKQIYDLYYIEIYLDLYFISVSEFYHREHFMHPVLIHGYDSEKKVFYIADFFKNRYESVETSYEEIKDSAKTIRYESRVLNKDYYSFRFDTIKMFKYVKSNYKFSITLFKKVLYDYLNEKDSFEKYCCYPMICDKKVIYGIGIYRALRYNVENANEYIDVRPFYVVYDHKSAMIVRITYLEQNGYVKEDDSDILKHKFIELTSETKKMISIILKFNITRDRRLKNKIINRICELEELERFAIRRLLDSIVDL